MTPENVRFHAAGHLAAAVLLVESQFSSAAKPVLRAVGAYINHPMVQAPPEMKQMVADATADPEKHLQAIKTLEEWFVHPLNTTIEKSGQL